MRYIEIKKRERMRNRSKRIQRAKGKKYISPLYERLKKDLRASKFDVLPYFGGIRTELTLEDRDQFLAYLRDKHLPNSSDL